MSESRSRVAGLAIAIALLATGCDEKPVRVPLSLHPGAGSDARYRIDVRLDTEALEASCVLTVRAEPAVGWHIAPTAPTRLNWKPSAHLTIEQTSQRNADAVAFDRDALEFRTQLGGCGSDGVRLEGRLKFGICEGDDERCAIVRRDLNLGPPLPGS